MPALEWLRSGYTEVWCAEQNKPLVQFADRVLSIGESGLDRVGVLNADDVFRRLAQFDRIHSWYGANRSDFRSAVADFPFHFYSALPDGTTHATDFYCSQVGAPSSLPRISARSAEPEDVVVLHPFASNLAKQWPLESFRALASKLQAVRWCAGPEDLQRNPHFTEPLKVIENLGELAARLAGARAYIGNDTGITHLAAAVSIPVVALFGPTDPAVWAPRGPNVRIIFRKPLSEITVNEVIETLYHLL